MAALPVTPLGGLLCTEKSKLITAGRHEKVFNKNPWPKIQNSSTPVGLVNF